VDFELDESSIEIARFGGQCNAQCGEGRKLVVVLNQKKYARGIKKKNGGGVATYC
jgi:hypothetical protein